MLGVIALFHMRFEPEACLSDSQLGRTLLDAVGRSSPASVYYGSRQNRSGKGRPDALRPFRLLTSLRSLTSAMFSSWLESLRISFAKSRRTRSSTALVGRLAIAGFSHDVAVDSPRCRFEDRPMSFSQPCRTPFRVDGHDRTNQDLGPVQSPLTTIQKKPFTPATLPKAADVRTLLAFSKTARRHSTHCGRRGRGGRGPRCNHSGSPRRLPEPDVGQICPTGLATTGLLDDRNCPDFG